MVPLTKCRNRCGERLDHTDLNTIHEAYWKLGTHDLRSSFVSGCITRLATKTMRLDKRNSVKEYKERLYAYKYFLEINGQKCNICQICFRKTLCESNTFLYTV